MLVLEKQILLFNIKEIYFCDRPFDVDYCDAVNFISCNEKIDKDGFSPTQRLTSVIDLTCDLDSIWSNLGEKSCRYEIKRAMRDGVKIKINERFDEFYRIYNLFSTKRGFNSPIRKFDIGLEVMKKYGTLFIAEYQSNFLGGHLYLEDKNNIELWLSASRRLEVNSDIATMIGSANRLLHWEAIKYAKEKGLKEFGWGGLWAPAEAEGETFKKNINAFKLSFGGKITTRYSYSKTYSKLYKAAQKFYKYTRKVRGQSQTYGE